MQTYVKPKAIRCALLPDGKTVEAAYMDTVIRRVEMDIHSGEITKTQNAPEGSDPFRWLVREVRKHQAS